MSSTRNMPHGAPPLPRSSSSVSGFSGYSSNRGRTIAGVLRRADGTPLPGLYVRAYRQVDGRLVGRGRNAATDADGRFEIAVDQRGDYVLDTVIGGFNLGCWFPYQEGGFGTSYHDASLVALNNRDVTGIDFVLPDGRCVWKITGRVLGPTGVPLPGLQVHATDSKRRSIPTVTGSDGSFSITAPDRDAYSLSVSLNGDCRVYHRPGAESTTVPGRDEDSKVIVRDGDVTGVEILVPDDACLWRLRGSLVGETDPIPLGIIVSVRDAGTGKTVGASLSSDGAFSTTVARDGAYEIEVRQRDVPNVDRTFCAIEFARRSPSVHCRRCGR